MKLPTVLCINGSDSLGHAGIQADIRTIKDLGGYAVTAITSVTLQSSQSISGVHELPPEMVLGQINSVFQELQPQVVKIGMVNNAETIRGIRNSILGTPRIVCSPVVLSSQGTQLMNSESIRAFCNYLLPISHLVLVKCIDAEIILRRKISTENDMKEAAQDLHSLGAEWVLLRGGTFAEGRINALLSGEGQQHFYSSVNIEGWQRHGVGGTLSTAIAARMAQGDEVKEAVANAHDYMHSQVVYASAKPQALQPHNLYNQFMTLLSENYRTQHQVQFYAQALSISTRYLSQLTGTVCGRSPKQIIDDYLLRESELLLATTSLTIQQISYELGFTSQVSFAKFFQARKHTSPSAFRVKK